MNAIQAISQEILRERAIAALAQAACGPAEVGGPELEMMKKTLSGRLSVPPGGLGSAKRRSTA